MAETIIGRNAVLEALKGNREIDVYKRQDPDDAALNDVLTDLAEKRDQRNRRLINVLNEMGFEISLDELKVGRPGGFIGKPVIARALADKGYIKNYEEAFKGDRFFGSPEARAVKKDKLQAAKAIQLIKAAGGIAVLAHPVQTRHIGDPGSEEFYTNIEKIIRQLKTQGISGLEMCIRDRGCTAQYRQT